MNLLTAITVAVERNLTLRIIRAVSYICRLIHKYVILIIISFIDACRYHSGEPFFHDAYKGWSCCNKKCTDFTEFLNVPGCTYSKHSNEKPPELPKPVRESNPEEVIEVKPIVQSSMQRPPLSTPMVYSAIFKPYFSYHLCYF